MTKKLMTHVVVGYPTLPLTDVIVDALVAGGSDYIELQIPFSDPLADGPLIMHASDRALAQGVRIEDVFAKASQYTRSHPTVKFLFVLYANTVMHYGIEAFCKRAHECEIYGLIVPDLPFDSPEGRQLVEAAKSHHLTVIPVIAPSTTESRLKNICASPHAFVYASSLMGVTGTKGKFAELDTYVARIRQYTDKPIAVGFGIKTHEDVHAVHQHADIAVIGSAIVQTIGSASPNEIRQVVTAYMRSLR